MAVTRGVRVTLPTADGFGVGEGVLLRFLSIEACIGLVLERGLAFATTEGVGLSKGVRFGCVLYKNDVNPEKRRINMLMNSLL